MAAVLLSDKQQPKSVSSQGITGQPLPFLPRAGETPSGQQPNGVSLQVRGFGQPEVRRKAYIIILYIQEITSTVYTPATSELLQVASTMVEIFLMSMSQNLTKLYFT